jgi:hypothetical protein
MRTKKNPGPEDNPVWKIINDPSFVKKCRERDRELVAQLQSLRLLSRETLGKHMRNAFRVTSDQRSGKFVRALSDAMTELANGDMCFAILEQCELPAQS